MQYDEAGAEMPDTPDPRQQAWDGVTQGTHYLTPQQRQAMATNAAKRAWLQMNDLPDTVRQKEMADVDSMDQRIVPIPRSPDEIPRGPSAQIAQNAFVDNEGKYGHPGATWVKNPKTGSWDVSRNAPNNQTDYTAFPNQESDQIPENVNVDPQSTILAQRMGGHSGGGRPAPWQPVVNGAALVAQQRIDQSNEKQAWAQQQAQLKAEAAQEKQRQAQEAHSAKQRDWHVEQELKRTKVIRNPKYNPDDYEGAKEKPTIKVPYYGTKDDPEQLDLDAARRAGLEQHRIGQVISTPEHMSYERGLEQQLGHVSRDELGKMLEHAQKYSPRDAATLQDEISRRDKGYAPIDATKRHPDQFNTGEALLPASVVDRFRQLTPAQMKDLVQHAKQRPMTPAEFAKKNPDRDYGEYMQIRNWAKRNPSLAPQYIAGPRPESQPESAPKRQYQMIEDAKRPGYFVQAPGAAQTPPAAPANPALQFDAQWKSLKSGETLVGPDGKTYRKK